MDFGKTANANFETLAAMAKATTSEAGASLVANDEKKFGKSASLMGVKRDRVAAATKGPGY